MELVIFLTSNLEGMIQLPCGVSRRLKIPGKLLDHLITKNRVSALVPSTG
jgi:hypothetical protein